MHTIALVNQKGGVGKSTTAVNLSAGLARLGRRVLLIDLDPQAHSTVALGVHPKKVGASIYSLLSGAATVKEVIKPISPGLSLIPSTINLAGGEAELTWQQNPHFILKKAMAELGEDAYDFAIVDSPPQLGFLNVNSLAWVKNVFIPVTCEFYALHGVKAEIQFKIIVGVYLARLLACSTDYSESLMDAVARQPQAILVAELALGRQRLYLSSSAVLLLQQAPTNLEALKLARRRAGKIVGPDVVAENSLRAGQLGREAFNVEANYLARIDYLACTKNIEIGDDYSVQALGKRLAGAAFEAHHTDVLDEGRLQIVRFDLLRINVLAVAENNYIFAAPSDKEISTSIEVA